MKARLLPQARLRAESEPVRGLLEAAFERVGPIGPSFSWSELQYGRCQSLSSKADVLYQRNVEPPGRPERDRVSDDDLRGQLTKLPSLIPVLYGREGVERGRTVQTPNRTHTFPAAWHNGVLQVTDTISFDYRRSESLVGHAERWSGRLLELSHAESFQFTAVCTDPPRAELGEAYERALALLDGNELVRKIISISEAPQLAELIEQDLSAAADQSRL